jgi:DNA repair protein RecO (recombination protein O)
MAIFTDIAVCLRKLDYSETSQVLTLFAREHGLVRVIAKGQKRSTRTRVAVGVDLLELGQAVWSAGPAASEGRLSTLREWRQQEIFPNVRQDLGAVMVAQYAAELIATSLIEADPHPEVFEVLCKFLGHIGAGKPNLASLVRLMWLVLHYSGHLPQWERCGVCGRGVATGEAAFFGLNSGGLICTECSGRVGQRLRVEGPLSEALQAGRPERAAGPGFALLDAYVAHLAGRPLRCSETVRWAMSKTRPAVAQAGGGQDSRQAADQGTGDPGGTGAGSVAG